VADAFDVVVGGPPCQAFARVGRSKLREIEDHPEAFIHDPRAQLYKKYLEFVDAFQPLAVLMENVPDILNHGGQNIAEETCEVLEAKEYVCGYTLLNAAFYGVPQMRERMFLIGYHRFPRPATGWYFRQDTRGRAPWL
jgi:DNA (cytosine-5)-methyltransferase 1